MTQFKLLAFQPQASAWGSLWNPHKPQADAWGYPNDNQRLIQPRN